jgi:hypothetical protein
MPTAAATANVQLLYVFVTVYSWVLKGSNGNHSSGRIVLLPSKTWRAD